MRFIIAGLLLCTTGWSTAAFLDIPPTITRFAYTASVNKSDTFKDLVEPQDYVIVGHLTDDPNLKSRILCAANYADEIYWEYRKNDIEEWFNGDLHFQVESETKSADGKLLTKIFSSSMNNIDSTKFYRCLAVHQSYKTISPTIRLVIAYIKDFGNSIFSYTVPGTPTVNQSYELPCFQDIDTQLVPTDAAEFIGLIVRWIRLVGNLQYPFPDGYDGAKDKGRLSVNPRTGALNYGYVLESDNLDAEENGKLARLQCIANLNGTRELIVGNYASMTVSNSTGTMENLRITSPKYRVVDGVKVAKHLCAVGKLCQIHVQMVGSLTKAIRVLAQAPEGVDVEIQNGTNRPMKYGGPYHGFELTSLHLSDEQRYTAELRGYTINADGEEVLGSLLDTIYFDVTVADFPELLDKKYFPKERIVPSGSDVFFKCDAKGADSAEFFINGIKINSTGTFDYISSITPTSFVVNAAKQENSFSVQCIATNGIGSRYESSNLIVYDVPLLTQTPKNLIPLNEDQIGVAQKFFITCDFNFGTKITDVALFWKTRSYQAQSMKITDDATDIPGVNGNLTVLTKITEGLTSSQLTLIVDKNSLGGVPNREWWCVAEYKVVSKTSVMAEKGVPILFIRQEITSTTTPTTTPTTTTTTTTPTTTPATTPATTTPTTTPTTTSITTPSTIATTTKAATTLSVTTSLNPTQGNEVRLDGRAAAAKESKNESSGVYIGIGIGLLVLVAIIVAVAVKYRADRKAALEKSTDESPPKEDPNENELALLNVPPVTLSSSIPNATPSPEPEILIVPDFGDKLEPIGEIKTPIASQKSLKTTDPEPFIFPTQSAELKPVESTKKQNSSQKSLKTLGPELKPVKSKNKSAASQKSRKSSEGEPLVTPGTSDSLASAAAKTQPASSQKSLT